MGHRSIGALALADVVDPTQTITLVEGIKRPYMFGLLALGIDSFYAVFLHVILRGPTSTMVHLLSIPRYSCDPNPWHHSPHLYPHFTMTGSTRSV